MVILFTIFTFVFATWGECRDRRKRLHLAERRSRMTLAEREKARLLQVGYRSQVVRVHDVQYFLLRILFILPLRN